MGGPTETWNGQALCSTCNQQKGMTYDFTGVYPSGYKPRDWQHEFLISEEVRGDGTPLGFIANAVRQATTPTEAERKAYVLNAFPGTGKTKAAMAAAKYLRLHNVIDTVVYLVPSDNLRHGAAQESERFSIPLREGKKDAIFDFQYEYGVVLTYHQIGNPQYQNLLRNYCDTRKVMVIADEMHHLGDNLRWGDAYSNTFGKALVTLLTTGTPFRSDGARIPGVDYVDRPGKNMAECVCHYSYGYAEALQDGAVRPVNFKPWNGTVSWKARTLNGQEVSHAIGENLRDVYPAPEYELKKVRSLEGDRRWHVFDTPRDTDKAKYLLEQLAAADQKLLSLRKANHPWAGGLIVARDTEHADEIARLMEQITGQAPEIVHSKDTDSASRLRRFTGKPEYGYNREVTRKRWLVSVGMVSEGVDIPFLRVLVWATNISAPLRFYQIVGRVLRKESGVEFQDAEVFIPEEPSWWELAQTMREAVGIYRIKQDRKEGGGGTGGERPEREGLGSEGEADGSLLHDEAGSHTLSEERRQKLERLALRFGWSESQLDQMWQRGGETNEEREENFQDFIQTMSQKEAWLDDH